MITIRPDRLDAIEQQLLNVRTRIHVIFQDPCNEAARLSGDPEKLVLYKSECRALITKEDTLHKARAEAYDSIAQHQEQLSWI